MHSENILAAWAQDDAFQTKWSAIEQQFALPADEQYVLYIARGRSGNRWFYDPRLGYRRLMDPYAENVPEALIKWCSENGWKLIILFEGERPAFDEIDLSYTDRFPDVVIEIDSSDLFSAFPRRTSVTKTFDSHYEDNVLTDAAFKGAFSYLDVEFFDTMSEQMQNLSALASGHAYAVERWRRVLGFLAPKVVFAGRLDIRPDICKACTDLNIMTAGVKLGIAEEMLAPFAMLAGDGSFNSEAFPDVLAIWGETQKELIEKRFPECTSHLVVSGRTRNDTFAGLEEAEDASRLREFIGVGADKKIFVYGANFATKFGKTNTRDYGACCMSPMNYKAYLRAIADFCEKRGDCVVVVKPHPADDINFVRSAVEEVGSQTVHLVTDEDGYHNAEILHASSVFISSVSSMFSEAVLSGCPAVNIWSPDVNYLYESGRLNAFEPISITATSQFEMREILDKLLDDEQYHADEMARMKDNMPKIFGNNDGANSQRLVSETMAFYLQQEPRQSGLSAENSIDRKGHDLR